ncbi:choice-of-anchor J domain-containing protein [Algibacter sp. 2305UL17-15]|uniref:T9SS-dependent choice-of-anchor J family protein n=1 Tax=Algibacter sp. 2305UL17-15 TaxID=3231268 RepID=UPI00345A2F61
MKKKLLLFLAFLPLLSFGQTLFSEDFETITDLPTEGWTLHNDSNTPNGTYATIFTDAWAIFGWAEENGNTTASTTSWFNPAGVADRWLVTPAITIPSGADATLTFKIRSHDDAAFADGYTLKLSTTGATKANLSTDLLTVANAPNDIIANVTTTVVDLSAYAGQTIHLAWVNNFNDGNLLSVDDITVTQGCSIVAGLSFDAFNDTSANISWGNTGDFEIEYGEFPYTQGGGGSTATVTGGSSYSVTGLSGGTSYNVFVRKNCGGGDFGPWGEVIIGTSPSPISSFPYNESFEPDANQALLLNFGINFAGTGAWNYGVDDTTDGDTTNDFASDGLRYFFSNNTTTTTDADAWLYIGPFNLSNGQEYTFTFQQRNLGVSSSTRPNKDLEVSVATTPDNTTDNIILTLDDLDNIAYQLRQATFAPTTNGNYYFGIHDKSSFLATATVGNSAFIDVINVTSSLSLIDFNKVITSISPNPTSNEFQINFGSLADVRSIDITLSDINGRLVKQFKVQNSYNISDLNTGVYILKITDGLSYHIQKLIKN